MPSTPSVPRPTAASRRLRAQLLSWYRKNRRDLPWRGSTDPYAILVSEVMLQQTTVKAVLPYYARFMKRFPGWRALAGASEEEVLAAWSGLGYYSRARNLHRTARWVVADGGGVFPRDPAAARRLPGVGEYTAGAVLSIAYDLPEPALDGNALRVLARLHGIEGDPRSSTVHRRLHSIVASCLPRRGASDFNQALMELGALVCTPAKPSCPSCPWKASCKASAQGRTGHIPTRRPRRDPVEVHSSAAVVRRAGWILLMRQGVPGSLGRFWELPGTAGADLDAERAPRRSRAAAPAQRTRARAGRQGARGQARRLAGLLARQETPLLLDVGDPLARVRHTVTHRRIILTAYSARLKGPLPQGDYRWARPGELGSIPLGTLTRKVLAAVDLTPR
jgi:A/G-specific adenine glycosylase